MDSCGRNAAGCAPLHQTLNTLALVLGQKWPISGLCAACCAPQHFKWLSEAFRKNLKIGYKLAGIDEDQQVTSP